MDLHDEKESHCIEADSHTYTCRSVQDESYQGVAAILYSKCLLNPALLPLMTDYHCKLKLTSAGAR